MTLQLGPSRRGYEEARQRLQHLPQHRWGLSQLILARYSS
jgi:hypothetical protein